MGGPGPTLYADRAMRASFRISRLQKSAERWQAFRLAETPGELALALGPHAPSAIAAACFCNCGGA